MKFVQKFAARHGIYYGWFTLAGAMLIALIVGGSFVNSFGVMLPVICKDFGWSRASVSIGLSLGVMAFGLPSPLFGRLVARWGPRFAYIIGNLLAVSGLAGMAFIREVWHVYALYLLIGVGAGFGGYITSATVLNNWFIKKRSLVMGLFVGSMGLGGFIFPPFVTLLIEAVGWQATWLILAALALVISVGLCSVILVRDKPEDIGLLPDGEARQPENGMAVTKEAVQDKASATAAITATTGSALALGTTWLIILFVAANGFSAGTLSTHQVAYLQDLGFAPLTAATTMSVMAVCNTIGSLFFGALAMRFHIRLLAMVAFLIQLAAWVVLIFVNKTIAVVYLYTGLFGFSAGALIAALPTFVGVYFTRERYAQVLGIVFPFQLIAMAIAATLAGIIFDATATYASAFALAAIMSLIGLVSASLVRPLRS